MFYWAFLKYLIMYAFIEDPNSEFYNEEIEVEVELIVGDFIRYFPDDNENFTNNEVDNGVLLEVVKRVYSTIDGMMFFCKHA